MRPPAPIRTPAPILPFPRGHTPSPLPFSSLPRDTVSFEFRARIYETAPGGTHAAHAPTLSPAQPLPFSLSLILFSCPPPIAVVRFRPLAWRWGASGPSSCRSARRCRRHVAEVASSGSGRSASTTRHTPRPRRRSRRCCSSGRRSRSLGPSRAPAPAGRIAPRR